MNSLNNDVLETLNKNPDFDFLINGSISNLDDNNCIFDFDPYADVKLNCKFYDSSSLVSEFPNTETTSKFLSLNIRSLNSNFYKLKEWIYELENNSVYFDVIGLQETWQIPYPELFSLDGFQPIVYKVRRGGRGGGVGFLVRQGLNFHVNNELSLFSENCFESICIQVNYSTKRSVNFISLYRPPCAERFNEFLDMFNHLTSAVSNRETFILTDSNLDLLQMNSRNIVNNFFYSAVANGFLNIISKATRISDLSSTLIDQIFTNSENRSFSTGVLIDRISDHFMTVGSITASRLIKKPNVRQSRNLSNSNKLKFLDSLSNLSWNSVLEVTDVNLSFSAFWDIFSLLFELHFPVSSTKFNKNVHKIQGFMSEGLLISRRHKLELSRQSIAFPTIENKLKFKNYRNMYI